MRCARGVGSRGAGPPRQVEKHGSRDARFVGVRGARRPGSVSVRFDADVAFHTVPAGASDSVHRTAIARATGTLRLSPDECALVR